MKPAGPAVGSELTDVDPTLELFGAATPEECGLPPVAGEAAVEEHGEPKLVAHSLR